MEIESSSERLLQDQQEQRDFEEHWKKIPQEQRLQPMRIRKEEYDTWVEQQRLLRTGGRPPMYPELSGRGVKAKATGTGAGSDRLGDKEPLLR